MTGMDSWRVVPLNELDVQGDQRLFFTEHEWLTVEAATARIIPTDEYAGAREAKVVRFIDRYISGIKYIFAAADGSGFLELNGKYADVWRARITELQKTYRDGVLTLDRLADELKRTNFLSLSEGDQDNILEVLSGSPKPRQLSLSAPESEAGTALVYRFDDRLSFFQTLIVHTTQGFYSDPIYGGNDNRQGWEFIGFPGPKSLKDTQDGTFSVKEYFEDDYDWADLILQLRETAE